MERKEPSKYPTSYSAFMTMRRDGFEASVRIQAWRGRMNATACVDGVRVDSLLSMRLAMRKAKDAGIAKLMRLYADAAAKAETKAAAIVQDAALSRTNAERPIEGARTERFRGDLFHPSNPPRG